MRRVAGRIAPALLLTLALLTACTSAGTTESAKPSSQPSTQPNKLPVRIGTVRVESALPIWVAAQKGLFSAAGLDAKVVGFNSAEERNAALISGSVDAMTGDPVSLLLLNQGGYPVAAVTTLNGVPGTPGRSGIVVGPKSTAKSLADLRGKTIGVSLRTHQAFIVDTLLARAGIPATAVTETDVNSMPTRYALLMQGKLDAAALPQPWLTLAQADGARLIASDATGTNLSAGYLIASRKWLNTKDGSEAMTRTLGAMAKAVELINANPDAARPLLVEKAGVSPKLATTYPVQKYPTPPLMPDQTFQDSVEQWALRTKILHKAIPYQDLVWQAGP